VRTRSMVSWARVTERSAASRAWFLVSSWLRPFARSSAIESRRTAARSVASRACAAARWRWASRVPPSKSAQSSWAPTAQAWRWKAKLS